jgi:hypothetical protein
MHTPRYLGSGLLGADRPGVGKQRKCESLGAAQGAHTCTLSGPRPLSNPAAQAGGVSSSMEKSQSFLVMSCPPFPPCWSLKAVSVGPFRAAWKVAMHRPSTPLPPWCPCCVVTQHQRGHPFLRSTNVQPLGLHHMYQCSCKLKYVLSTLEPEAIAETPSPSCVGVKPVLCERCA